MSLSFLTHPYPDCKNVFKNVQFQHDFSVIKTYFFFNQRWYSEFSSSFLIIELSFSLFA